MRMLEKAIIVVAICTAVIVVSAWWVAQAGPKPQGVKESAMEKSIEIVADGPILHYQENLFWSENQFFKILEDQDNFLSAQIEKFNERYNVIADNFSVEFDEKNRITTFECDVHGKEYAKNSYDFLWFLNVYGLDLIYDFTKSERKLSWEGTADNIYTTIILSFPFSIDHCHGHVWPE